jgi:hypothetical protein
MPRVVVRYALLWQQKPDLVATLLGMSCSVRFRAQWNSSVSLCGSCVLNNSGSLVLLTVPTLIPPVTINLQRIGNKTSVNFVTCMGWLQTGYGLVNGFIDHLYTHPSELQAPNAIADFHTSQITTALAKPFPACCVLTSRFLVTASNSGDSSTSLAQVLLSQPPVQNSLSSVNSTIAPSHLKLPCIAQLTTN